MKTKVKVNIDGTDREVEVDLTPEQLKGLGLLTQEDIRQSHMPKDAFEAELDRRVKSLTKGKYSLEDLDSDADLKKRVLEKLGVKVTKDGKAELTADQVAELEESWKKRHLEPVLKDKERFETRARSLQDKMLERDIIQAAAEFGIKKSFLTPVSKDQSPPIVTMLRGIFAHSEEQDSYFVKKGDGFEFSSDPKGTGSPYMGVREFVSTWARDKANIDFVDAKRPGGPGVSAPAGGQGGTVTLDRPEGGVMTLQDYKSAQQQAGDGGRVVVKTAAG